MVEHDSSIDNETLIQAKQLERLRNLVAGPVSKSVRRLRAELQNQQIDAEEISRILPSAIRKSSKDKDFAKALGPTLSKAFEDSVKKDPQGLANAIAPIMGPAIRRSITDQIRAMVQSLNTALDHSLSPRGIRWRIEAWRTGKPFAEVVLLHTLVYRIEQLLLIDPETGLLMQSVSAIHHDDADVVSSLLLAIQDFMRDSFEHRSMSSSELQTLNTEELTLLIEHGPRAILVAAVRGMPPMSLRERLVEAVERIHIQYGALLSCFRGDTTHLEEVRPDLEELLVSEFVDQDSDSESQKQEDANRPGWKQHLRWVVPACLLILVLMLGLTVKHSLDRHAIAEVIDLPPTAKIEIAGNVLRVKGSARHDWIVRAKNRMDRLPEFEQLDVSMLKVSDQAWIAFIEALHDTPGIAVTSARREGNEFLVAGWRDPLSDDPSTIMSRFQLDPKAVKQKWEAYRAMDPRLSLRRLKTHLSFPDTVELSREADALILKGSASAEWLQKLRYAMSLLDIHLTLNISELTISGGSD